jgi:hypothetical protein
MIFGLIATGIALVWCAELREPTRPRVPQYRAPRPILHAARGEFERCRPLTSVSYRDDTGASE